MLIDFFYTLRAAKLPVSVKEYLTLLEAMDKGEISITAAAEQAKAAPKQRTLFAVKPKTDRKADGILKAIRELARRIEGVAVESVPLDTVRADVDEAEMTQALQRIQADQRHNADSLAADLRRIQNDAELKRGLKEQWQLAKAQVQSSSDF